MREPRKRDAHSDKYGMSLPTGKTCGDCKHFEACKYMISAIELDEICDWSPNNFQECVQAVGAAEL